MEKHGEDRKEPKVEIGNEPEERSFSSAYQGATRPSSIKRWILVPILLLGIVGLAFGLWMILPSGGYLSKKQPESPELITLKAEVLRLKGESDLFKKEIQSLKEELKIFQEQAKSFQEQIKALNGQLISLSKKKEPQEDKKPAPKAVVYKIKKGETLASIAKKFRVRPDDLRRWNRLPSKGKLKPGQIITIYFSTP